MLRFCILAVWLASTATVALAEPPSISHTSPTAVKPGATTDITLFGKALAGPTEWWSSFPSTAAVPTEIDKNGTLAEQVTYRVQVPAETPLGIGVLRIATSQGASGVRLVLVDELASTMETAGNKDQKSAQLLSIPAAVDAACEAESNDYFRFTVQAGQRLSFEVVARRLGYPTDPVMRLLDAQGREIAFADDDTTIGVDCRLSHEFAAAGEYVLELRDVRYQGGPQYRYRLRIGDFPLVAAPFPLAVEPGAANEHMETEPNDARDAAGECVLPGAVNGVLAKAGDVDWYRFQARGKERLAPAAHTRGWGSAADLLIGVYKPDGSLLAEADDVGADDAALDVTIPADGEYRLKVEDVGLRGGAEFVYRISCQSYRPGFSLALEGEKFDAPKGGVFTAKVTCVRRDYNGPITLELDGAGDGFVLANNVIAEGKNETTLHATVPAALASGRMLQLRVAGRAKIGEEEFRTTAGNAGALRAALAGWSFPPRAVEGLVALGVGPEFPKFFDLTAEPKLAALSVQGGSVTVKIAAKRHNGFDDAIALAVEGLPANVTVKTSNVDKGKGEANVEITSTSAAAPGRYVLKLGGSAVFQNQPQRFVVEPLVLRVGPPFTVAAAVEGPLTPSAKQKIKLSLAGELAPLEKRRLALAWKNLPSGVTGPAEAELAGSEKELAVELAADASAAAGKYDVSVSVTTDVDGRQEAVDSPAFGVEIRAP